MYVIQIDIFCDGCGTWDDRITRGSKRQARRAAKSLGWVREDGLDLCPECQPKPFKLEDDSDE